MSGDVQLELYLHEYKMTALSSVLAEQDSNVEERMQEMLIDLYAELVPHEVQREMGGLSDVLLGMPMPEGPCLTADDLRSELAEVSATLEQRHSQSAAMEVSM